MRFGRRGRANLDWLIAKPIAHRGLHDSGQGVIENSKSAFNAAIKAAYPIECDLQITGQGEPIVFHDETLERLTCETGSVKDRSTLELRDIKLKGSDDRIQSLSELLDQVRGRVPLVIELKSHWNDDIKLVDQSIELLAKYSGPYALMSFDPALIKAARRLAPDIVRGIVADRVSDPYYSFLPFSRRLELRSFSHFMSTMPHFISFDWTGLPFGPVSALHRCGVPVICWTVRSPEAASQARRYADQITFEGFRP
jgi:glycerophosphoryl diester phosphodiesterase